MPGRGDDDFERWGSATVNAAASELMRRLEPSAKPRLGGEGGPRTTKRGYRSAFVRFTAPMGGLAVWLFCVPPGHEYSDSPSVARLGAGILDDALRPLPEGRLRAPLGGRIPLIRRRQLPSGWASDLAYIDADVGRSPDDAGCLLAERAYEGLVRLRAVK